MANGEYVCKKGGWLIWHRQEIIQLRDVETMKDVTLFGKWKI